MNPKSRLLATGLVFLVLLSFWGIQTRALEVDTDDLNLKSVKRTGMDWKIDLTVDIDFQSEDGSDAEEASLNNPRLEVNYYEGMKTGISDFNYLDPRPLDPKKDYFDYKVSFKLSKTYHGESIIEVCVTDEDTELDCTSWQGWIPQKPEIATSGSFDFPEGTEPEDEGLYESETWTVAISTATQMGVEFFGLDLPIGKLFGDFGLPTWWRCWNDKADRDGALEGGEVIDTGWQEVASQTPNERLDRATILAGWSGELNLQLRIKRSGYDDRAGDYQGGIRLLID